MPRSKESHHHFYSLQKYLFSIYGIMRSHNSCLLLMKDRFLFVVTIFLTWSNWTRSSQVAQVVKNLFQMQETYVWSLGRGDLWEEEMASHSSIPAWKLHRGAWKAAVHGVRKSQTWLTTLTTTNGHTLFPFPKKSQTLPFFWELQRRKNTLSWKDTAKRPTYKEGKKPPGRLYISCSSIIPLKLSYRV